MLLVALALAAAPMQMQSPGLTCVGVDPKACWAASDALTHELAQLGVVVVPKDARALDVDAVLSGRVSKASGDGGALAVSAIVVAPRAQKPLATAHARVKDQAALLAWTKGAALQLVTDTNGALGRPPLTAPQGGAPIAPIAPPPPKPLVEERGTHEVEWGGRWWPATVLMHRADGATRIHYVGYDASWDEWVPPSRIRALAAAKVDGELVDVEWKGTWYRARVLRKNADGTALIHYEGYDASWDETVPPARMRASNAPK